MRPKDSWFTPRHPGKRGWGRHWSGNQERGKAERRRYLFLCGSIYSCTCCCGYQFRCGSDARAAHTWSGLVTVGPLPQKRSSSYVKGLQMRRCSPLLCTCLRFRCQASCRVKRFIFDEICSGREVWCATTTMKTTLIIESNLFSRCPLACTSVLWRCLYHNHHLFYQRNNYVTIGL